MTEEEACSEAEQKSREDGNSNIQFHAYRSIEGYEVGTLQEMMQDTNGCQFVSQVWQNGKQVV